MKKTHFIIAGILNLLFGLFHLFFWKFFDWPDSLIAISHDNRAILQVANIQLAFLILFFGYVSIIHYRDLFAQKIGIILSTFIASFYLVRIVNEVIFWGVSSWESTITIAVCAYLSAIYVLPIFYSHKTDKS